MSNTQRIAKNTLMLYFRQMLIMLVSLYTVRVVLETLGAEDYGIYNVVAGVVTMFGFLSNSMATASQRYFSFELGRGDYEQLKRVFSLSFTIYLMIAVLVLVLAETVGLWFVINKLVIPPERKIAALWVYQFSIISFLFTISTAPYMAAIIAHEDMNIYAYISIVEVLLKLGIVFFLQLILLDKLQLYGILLCTVTIVLTAVYRFMCRNKYKECKYRFYWDKGLFKELTGYTGWNLFGASAGIFKFQMVNILLNQFFNPVVIAARGIASSVNSAVVSFSQSFSTAMRPQIVKSYAAGKREDMLQIMYTGSKGTFFLMYIFVLPLVLEMPVLLSFWLKNPPEYAVLFTRLILLDALIDSVSYPIIAAAQATGKIKLYQSVVGGILILNLPLSWLVLSFGAPPYSVLVIAVFLTFFAFLIRLIILKQLIDFFIVQYIREVLFPVFLMAVLSIILPAMLYLLIDYSFLRSLAVIGSCFLSVCCCFYFIGLTGSERENFKVMIMGKLY